MRTFNRLAAALAAAVALAASLTLLSTAPAHADTQVPVVTAADVDVTANVCTYSQIVVSNLFEGADQPEHYWIIDIWGPDGYVTGRLWSSRVEQPVITGFCSADLPVGHYTVNVDGTERGSFNVYRPVLSILDVVPPLAARAKAHPRKATALLTLRGAPMPGTAVTVRNHYSGKDHVSVATTSSTGQATARCPRGVTCRVAFTYEPLSLSTGTVKVRRR